MQPWAQAALRPVANGRLDEIVFFALAVFPRGRAHGAEEGLLQAASLEASPLAAQGDQYSP